MPQLFKNNARATLGGSGLSSAVGADGTFSVATGKGALFPGIDPIVAGTYFDVTIQDASNIEIIRIKKRASDVFTIDSRAREGTTASTFASGAIVSLRLTAAVMESTLAHPAQTNAAHAASAISYAGSTNLAATNVEAALDELDAEKEAVGVASSTMSTHTSAPDPHPQYALDSDLTSGLAGKQNADAGLSALAALVFSQGDLIYATGPDALSVLSKGSAGQKLAMNPTATAPLWQTDDANGEFRAQQVFTASGTYTKPVGLKRVRVTVVGGGGGGGGGDTNGAAGRRGGGGGFSQKVIEAASVGATETVTVGAGGSGGPHGGGAGSNGSAGGTTSFGTHLSATGGGGGGGAGVFSTPAGGAGSGGQINIAGSAGGQYSGGSSRMSPESDAVNGGAGALYGGAGDPSSASGPGGAGASGIVIVEEFF